VGLLTYIKDRLKGPAAAAAEGPIRTVVPPSRSSQSALSGYGNNPYDTYTWELHTQSNGDRTLEKTTDIDRKRPQDGDPFNPYDTGRFRGW
jgi:hypothetical protein